MLRQLVQCIPNFSEGRRLEDVDSIIAAIQSVPGVLLLDRSSDPDHNRSVITFAGSPDVVSEAAFRSIQMAAEKINMNIHEGQHPCIGSADVVPFVPLSGVAMSECVELARALGKRVGEELSIPVFLYEAAATRPERQHLENIRRGGYETLKKTIGSEPDWQPDFGPFRLGSAGATVIGARAPLIAFNVYLTTNDVTIARQIARQIRKSSGGFPGVKAIGVVVGGYAQIAINFTDHAQTSIPQVVETIRRESSLLGTRILRAELIGLMPVDALVDIARWYLQLDSFSPDQILETRLYSALGYPSTLHGD
jgi:glutamate formiminotransferase